MHRQSKQQIWYKVSMIFLDRSEEMRGQGVETICITRKDVAERLGCTKKTATKYLAMFVREGLLHEDFIPYYGNMGLYEYWLSDKLVERFYQSEGS